MTGPASAQVIELYLVLLGPPGAGKGTQAAKLAERLSVARVASGDLFRENIGRGTPLGQRAKAYVDRGALVPDDLTVAMVMERLRQPDCRDGALLDGFPRTMAQAQALDQELAGEGKRLAGVLYIKAPDQALLTRLTGRLTCSNCQATYHQTFHPPQAAGRCDRCGGQVYQREDDTWETARRRLEVYFSQTMPLIEYYRHAGLLVEINGDQDVESVQQELVVKVNALGAAPFSEAQDA